MKIIAAIPARFASTRFPGKILADLNGKPLLQWVIEGTQKSKRIEQIYVPTDDERIFQLAVQLGCKAVMTSPELPSGTDRIYAALKNEKADVVINIQGDEPLVQAQMIDLLAEAFLGYKELEMATLATDIDREELLSPNVVKVIVNQQNEAIYFSRFPIPYSRIDARQVKSPKACLKHIGMYAYSTLFLKKFCEAPPAEIEKAEGLEQLRALYLGTRLRVLHCQYRSLGVDTPEDLEKVKRSLKG